MVTSLQKRTLWEKPDAGFKVKLCEIDFQYSCSFLAFAKNLKIPSKLCPVALIKSAICVKSKFKESHLVHFQFQLSFPQWCHWGIANTPPSSSLINLFIFFSLCLGHCSRLLAGGSAEKFGNKLQQFLNTFISQWIIEKVSTFLATLLVNISQYNLPILGHCLFCSLPLDNWENVREYCLEKFKLDLNCVSNSVNLMRKNIN